MSSASTMQRPKTQDERDLVLYESRLQRPVRMKTPEFERNGRIRDRKSTRLNSSHSQISYAVFCLKKKTIPAMNRIVLFLATNLAVVLVLSVGARLLVLDAWLARHGSSLGGLLVYTAFFGSSASC